MRRSLGPGIMERATRKVLVALCSVLVLGSTVSACSWYVGGTNPCTTLEQKLVAEIIQSYSGTEAAPNLLEPLALAVAPKKVNRFVENKSRFGCALTLYHLSYNPEAIEQSIEEGGP